MIVKALYGKFDYVDSAINRWLLRYSIALLRISLGAVFFGFGVLKFFPNLSPAQSIATQTIGLLTFGVVPAGIARVLLACLECGIGLSFITGRGLRIAVWLLGIELIGILSPLVLLPKELFTGPFHAPNLVGQYVLKDVVLAGAGMVIAATLRGGRLSVQQEARVAPQATRLATQRRHHPAAVSHVGDTTAAQRRSYNHLARAGSDLMEPTSPIETTRR